MASSSSSRFNAFSGIEPDGKRRKVSESSRLYDVFINHRGPDVKQTLAAQLYNSLEEVGIRAFLDSEEMELGESFPSTIETAIKSAKVHIAIFSKGYAESPWCLAELVLMLQSQAKIIPVFYQVKPSDLRFIEKGEYAKAFTEYEDKKRYLEKLPEWKEALQSLSFVTGEEFNGDCKKIIAAVQKEVRKKICLHVAAYPVGLDNLVEDFQRRCLNDLVQDFENECGLEEGKHKAKVEKQCSLEEGKHKAKVVGIFGMGGAGKTTLAKEIFNRKKSNYTKASFLFDVREASTTGRLPSLQGKLLKDLFQVHHLDHICKEEGMSYLKDHLQRSRDLSFLIVVDDIDHVEQLNALMIMDILDKFDNILVIVTTRDTGVLIRAGITDGYHLKRMDRNNGRELFCWHAFNQSHPYSGYEVLVDYFVDVCGGLPLSLQVLGRHVHGKPDSFWKSALIQAKMTLPRDVKNRLQISFDALSGVEKEIFMDIACFFIGKLKSIAERVWEGSGWHAHHALEMLKDKCLVEEIKTLGNAPELRMHDHLRDLGREMASKLGTARRLWLRRDLLYLESLGLKKILAKNVRCFHSMFDDSRSYKVTFFIGQSDICFERSASLLWIDFEGISGEPSIPSWISLRYVQYLKIRHARLNGTQGLFHLKELQITQCPEPGELRLEHLGCLEKIAIENCNHLKSVSGINNLAKLVKLNISECPQLELEELRLEHLGCLEKIAIENCNHLKSVSGINNLAKLVKLNISECPQLELEELRLEHLGCLEKIAIENCNHLKSVSGINNLAKLVELDISDCRKLEFECLCLSGMMYLERIRFDRYVKVKYFELDGCQNLKSLRYGKDRLASSQVLGESLEFDGPIGLVEVKISGCEKIKLLHFDGCQNLKSVSSNFEIQELEMNNCQNLKSVSGNFLSVYIDNCPELEELPSFSSAETICITYCGKLHTIMLPTSPTSLTIKCCPNLVGVKISGCGKSKLAHFDGCQNLKSVSSNFKIEELEIKNCQNLKSMSGDFVSVYIDNCPELEELPSFSSAETFRITYCGKLHTIMLPTSPTSLTIKCCPNLVGVKISGCGKSKLAHFDGCQNLISLSSNSEIEKLEINNCQNLRSVPGNFVNVYIGNCPELEELLSFSSAEKIRITYCGKLHTIMLPTSLTSLTIKGCSNLERVLKISDLTEVKRLYICKCPELEMLPSFSSLGSCEDFPIESCETRQNMAGIEELHVSNYLELSYCRNAVIRSCIHKLKNVPLHCLVIGRAVAGAESALNENLFSDADIVTDIVKYGEDTYEKWKGFIAIQCCVVVVDDSSTSRDISSFLWYINYNSKWEVRQGEWIITIIGRVPIIGMMEFSEILKMHGIMKKGFQIGIRVDEDEERKSMQVLHTIVDRLYHS